MREIGPRPPNVCYRGEGMSPLVHVAYASEACVELPDQAVRDLLESARRNNAAIGVTGMMLLVGASFFQILEGELDAVTPLYAKIARDPRHRRIVKLIQEPIEHRDFQDWSMGLARMTPKELAAVPGLNDFFSAGSSLDKLGEGVARKLLSQFKEGAWRARVAH